MTYTRKTLFDRVIAAALAVLVVVALMPVTAVEVAAETNTAYGTVSTYTGGTISNNGTANVEVLVEETTLNWVPANELRSEGWWVGIDVVAPEGFSADATYKVKTNPTAEYGAAKKFAEMKDGENDIQLWFPVSAASLESFAAEGRNLTMTYAFDWDNNGAYEQTIVFSVVPSEKIVLMKGEDQVYPVEVGYGTVSTYTGGTISNNGTANVEVLVEETTLNWVPANELRSEGWWVGIDVVAPEGFSADATYKVKTNPTAEYGAAKKFAEMKDGENDIQLWFAVSAASLESFAAEGRNLTMTYAFDWDNNGDYEQTVVFSVVPSEKIILMKGEDQVYPVLKSTVSVSKNEGGTVKLNGNAADSLVVENGTDVNVVVEATAGYQISSVTINGVETVVDAQSYTGTIAAIDADAAVSVVFVKLYTITVSGNANGNITTTPENQGGSVTVVKDSKVIVTATPSAGHRVSGVKINGEEQIVSGANNSNYTTEITADAAYSIEITFAPNVYKVNQEASQNGTFEVQNPDVEHGGFTDVVITPAAGYTVNTYTVEGATVSAIVKDANGIRFTVSDIVSDVTVKVTFKATAKAAATEVSMDTENVSLRKTASLFVVKEGDAVTFKTVNTGVGMRVYDDLGVVQGDETTEELLVSDTNIAKMELYYQADGELYADWHVVDMDAVRIVEDVEDPVLSLEPATAATNGYYNANVTMQVNVEDQNFYSGIAKVEYWITCNGVVGAVTELTDFTAGAVSYQDTFEIEAALYNSDDVKVSLRVTDIAGNVATIEKAIKINTTIPTIQLNMDGQQDVNALDGYYETSRVLKITINDRQGTFSAAAVAAGLTVKKNGVVIPVNEADINWRHSVDGETHVGEYLFGEEAEYEWEIAYTNLAGTQGVIDDQLSDSDINAFVIDHTAPTDLRVSYEPNVIDTILENITFGFYKAPVKVTIQATDAVAGIEQFTYSYTVENDASVTNSGASNVVIGAADIQYSGNTATATFEIPAQFRGKVSFSAMDKSGQISELKTDSKVIVVDTVAPGVVVSYDGPSANNGKYYNAKRTLKIEITEANFFETDMADDLLVITIGKTYNDGTTSVEKMTPSFTKNGDVYTAIIELDENADYTFDIQYTDRSGNVYNEYIADEFTIDTIAPLVDIVFDNNNALNVNHYAADRLATITVTEHNFDAKDFVATVTVDGVVDTAVTARLQDNANWTSNGDSHTATILFDQNADYTFDVKYTDCAGFVYDDYAVETFTIDKIKPVISIDYDNHVVSNGKYYNAARKATITVTEHNFRAADMVVEIAAEDVTGAAINLAAKEYANYLQNQSNWTANGDTWTAEILLDVEGNYTIGMTYTDPAGNVQETAIDEEFCVDTTVPQNLKISYETEFVDVLLETITFGFYKAPVTVTIEATDDYAGIDYFTYSYTVQNGASATNTGKTDVKIESANITYNGNKATASFQIPAQFRGNVSFTATDRAGYSNNFADGKVLVVDNVAPGVNVQYDNNAVKYGKFYAANRTATITITEANFFVADQDDALLVITVGKTLDDGTATLTNVKPVFTKNGDVYTATIDFTENADYTFDIKYTDRSGNVYDDYVMDEFTIDKIQPVVSVSYDNNTCKNQDQFNADRKATITVTEHNFIAADVVATITANGTAVASYADYLKNDANWTHNGDVHTAVIDFTNEAHYTFAIACADQAGNANVAPVDFGASVAPEAFTLDKSAPTEMAITIDDVSVLGNNSVAYDKFYSKAVVVKLGANCDISGMESLKYQKVVAVSDYDVNGTWIDYNPQTGILVNPSEKFVIYFRAEDRAGNVSIVNSTGIVVDNKKPTGETKAPEIDILPATANEYGFYNGNVSVDIKVIDPKFTGESASATGFYSGLNKITYRIYTTDTDAVEEGVLFDLAGSVVGAEFDADNLVNAWSGKITVDANKFNSNNVFVEITAVDNAGNIRTSTTAAGQLKIDITPSQIEITYDNNDGDTTFADGTYFDADRVATIVVTERNFDPALFVAEITNTDGYVPVIGAWTTVNAGGNGDGTTHTAKILFNKDGDYTLAVSCVDKALNANVAADTKASLAPWAFTVDKTAPVLDVVYDNNDVRNGNYYKEQRVATLTIIEHNFETGRVNIRLRATDDGNEIALPAVSNWTSNGDVHTATITYAADALYSFDMDYSDKAGNATADIAEQTFYVDKTNPTLTIEKIVDESANNDEGNIGFVMTATDTNFDVFTPVLTAVVKNGNGFETKQLAVGQTTDIKNGKVYTVTNVEEDGIYRITCTIVDKAGNAYSEVTLEREDGGKYVEHRNANNTLLTFSVNRLGSSFEVDKDTQNVLDRYYVQTVNNDVVVVEVNADPLQEQIVTLNGKELVRNIDYVVTTSGGNGAWMKYTYQIYKDLFEEEGEYNLVVSSKDKAENDAFSDIKDAAISFVVDRTAPAVSISGISNNGRYQTERQLVTLRPTDAGGALNTLIVYLVDDNGKVIKELVNLSGEELLAELEATGGEITFEIEQGLYQNVQIICTDCATGDADSTNTYKTTVKNVSVSTSGFMIFWANKPLRWATIGGISAVLIALAVFIVLKKRKTTK